MEHSVKILLFLILTSLTSPLLAADWTIGILALRGETATRTHWQSLVDSLNHAVPDANFRLLPLDLDGMREAVNQGTIQFVLTNPGQFVQLNSHYHLRWLSSLRSGQGDALESMATGSTILVRDGSGITHPQDLAGKTLGEMASGFAHELNQPLAAIRMYAQGGLNHLSAAENHAAVEKALINIESQAERCGLIIRHLREWATPARQNEHATENYIPCDVAGTLKQVLTLLQLDKAAPGLSVCLNSHQSIMLFLPPVLLEQVLANIILNAVQAGACNLWIDLHRDEQQYLIALQDDAGGIPAEQISDLFRPFHSGKKTGMGLGLVICQRLLRGVHGEISVNNHRAPDGSEGVRVTLTFPADDNNGKTQ